MDVKTGFVSGPVEFVAESNLFSRMQKLEFAGLSNNWCRLDRFGKSNNL